MMRIEKALSCSDQLNRYFLTPVEFCRKRYQRLEEQDRNDTACILCSEVENCQVSRDGHRKNRHPEQDREEIRSALEKFISSPPKKERIMITQKFSTGWARLLEEKN